MKGNYHSQPHKDHAFTLTTTLISYNASKRGINCYPKPDGITPHGIEPQDRKRHQSTVLKFTLPLPTSIKKAHSTTLFFYEY
ncbi:unnamed protein product [Brassica napus]|uniref:(rape) hypothetical protein n=1 Tax=Brassica napus TaxID=3708 RepID=A0A816J3D2_BRANA|nr:unnamed protein product [Brassica napus]